MDLRAVRNAVLNRLVLSYALDWIFIAYVHTTNYSFSTQKKMWN